jgi:EAL domain-containing protein (putative c-di-GMP-specific phosphodiesterase class I)
VVRDALELHSLDPQRLTVEVTESVMSDDSDLIYTQLNTLRGIGVKISLDDFGTGYSSMAYFRDLPADEIKVDKSFVMPMRTSKVDNTIVKTIIDLAHNFKLEVVAEGVEDEETAIALRDLGCDTLQGYLIDAPLPVESLEQRHHLI